ncbi:MAG: hypothetical protein ACRYFW_08365 [Janthinobacterium lividum]
MSTRITVLALLKRWPIGDREFDLRYAFAAGVAAERSKEPRPPLRHRWRALFPNRSGRPEPTSGSPREAQT